MTEKELLKNGYLPKELPPPFESKTFSQEINDINSDWNSHFSSLRRNDKIKFLDSNWANFSIPKVQLSRRTVNIPNPLHHSKLCKTIADNWSEIEDIFSKSNISSSTPKPDRQKFRTVIPKDNFGEFKRKRLSQSFDNLYEVKTDVSRFYGTIYTHSIPWLVHTKPVAKANRTDLSMLGNALDKDLRNLNSGQTVGIPVGPDSSLIVAEIITSLIDEQIQKKLKKVKSFRFIDDYYLYCDSYADAEKAFKFIQSILTEYQLDINEEKTKISQAPFAFDTKWSIELGSFTFRKRADSQLTDIERFVSLSLLHSAQNPKDSVLLFSIQVLKYLPLFEENWDIYESLILKIGITEPRTLPVVTEILSSNKSRISKKKIKSIIKKIISIHLPKGHNYEIAWALWMCVEFEISLKNKVAEKILASNDKISVLIALDLQNRGLINSSVSTSHLTDELTEENLMNENWLFTYETIKKGWLTPTDNPIDKNKYFEILIDKGVYFYNENAKVKTYTVKQPQTEMDGATEKPKEIEAKRVISFGGGGSSY